MEEIDLSKEIEKILLNSNRSKEIKSGEEVNNLSKKTGFLGVHTHEFGLRKNVFKGISIERILMGFSLSGGCVVFSRNEFCISMNQKYNVFSIDDFRKLSIERDGMTSDSVFLNGQRVGSFNRKSIDPWKQIWGEINTFFEPYLRIYSEEKLELENQKIKNLTLQIIKNCEDCEKLIEDCEKLIEEIIKTQGNKLDLNKIEIKLKEQKRMIGINSRFLNNESVISNLDLLKDLNIKFQKQVFDKRQYNKTDQEKNNFYWLAL